MKKLRGQKKDVTRALKAMKIEQSTRYYDTINDNRSSSKEYKFMDAKIIYSSITKKEENTRSGSKRRSLRYARATTQNENNSKQLYRQGRSMDIRNSNFLKISQGYNENENNNKNPYLTKKKDLITFKQLRRSSHQPRRIITQQSYRAEQPQRKTLYFKTINYTENGNNHNRSNVTLLLQQAKRLSTNGSFNQSQTLLERILRQDPENKEALYIYGMNNYKQMNYSKCLQVFNRLVELDPFFNKNAYIMSSDCFSKKGFEQQAMQRINACLACFPDYYDAHFQKAKLYIKAEDLDNAIKNLKKALKLAKDPYECCLKLGECYEKTYLFELAIKLYDHIIKQPNISKDNQSRFTCFLKKAQCEKKLQKYADHIQTLKSYLKIVDKNLIPNLARIYYEIGYAYYKINGYPNAIMNLEEAFQEKSKKQSTQSLILTTIIHIKRRDFYEAYHALLRKQHIQIEERQILFYEKFCEGVLSLMKRKFEIGLQRLLQIESQAIEPPKNEFQSQITLIYPLYLSYGYFCLNRMDKCIRINKKILQQNNPLLKIYRKGVEFNQVLCEGLEEIKHKRFAEAKQFFEKSTQIYSNKPEGYLYLGVTLIYMYLKNYNEDVLKKIKAALTSCIHNLKQLNNNYAACAYYIKAAFSAFMGDWENAINQIDESIERAQDNDAKSFYLRALILGCCQNFQQAISQVSIAISLNDKDPAYYLFRSKCQQIEGDGNKAFLDLQQYIALCPDDTEIHKYAGHLLFENGAFEDAIQAYENGQINIDIPNYDVFMTRSKTYFLLGNFQKCVQDMQIANKLNPNDPSVSFDITVIQILSDFFKNEKTSNLIVQSAQKSKEELENVAALGQEFDFGRIFKKIQISMLLGMLLFYMGRYKEAARQFKQTQSSKQSNFGTANESQLDQQLKQKQFFIAQMQYNRAICFLMINQPLAALKTLQQCNLQLDSKSYNRLMQLINALKSKKGTNKNIDVFSQKNKMSRMLNELTISIAKDEFIKLKLCIPFPKVEPPEINPKFQIRILRQIDIESIQKKPQAPWIIREQNSIKFTEVMQNFSRLEINNSELSKHERTKKQINAEQQQEQSINMGQYEQKVVQSLTQLRQKLRLDDKIEFKLNKILNKNK